MTEHRHKVYAWASEDRKTGRFRIETEAGWLEFSGDLTLWNSVAGAAESMQRNLKATDVAAPVTFDASPALKTILN